MKTIKSFTKRFKVTRRGKVLKRKAGQDHLNAKESGAVTRRKRNDVCLGRGSAKTMKRIIK